MSPEDKDSESRPLDRARSRPVLIVGLLGLNCWVTTVGLPAWHVANLGNLSPWVLGAAGVALAALVAGSFLLARRAKGAAALLLAAYPVLVVSPALIQPTLVRSSVLSASAVTVAGVSFAVYLIGACWACSLARFHVIEFQEKPLQDQPPPKRRILPGVLLVSAAATSAVVIATGHLQDFAEDASRIRILSAGALALWAVACFGIVAPALRRRRPWPLSAPSRGAAFVWLLVVVIGVAMLALASID